MPSDKPEIHLNLDSFLQPDKADPFAVVLGGKRYVLADLHEEDYRVLVQGLQAAAAGDPESMLHLVVPADERDVFFANKIPAFKLQGLMEAYLKHYGINPGEAFASPPS